MRPFSHYILWLLLSIPAIGMMFGALSSEDPRIFKILLHPSGEFSARFLIIAMLASPLTLIFRGRAIPRWLMKNRRYFGVASFGYALLHTLFYLIDKNSIALVTQELSRFYIWTGWVAFMIFIPLAITSRDHFVRSMGRNWKKLQRLTYIAAVLTLFHWAALHDWHGVTGALVHFGPLIVLEAYRAFYWLRKRQRA